MQTPYRRPDRPLVIPADARRSGASGDRRRPDADDRLEEIHHRRLHARRQDDDDQDEPRTDR